MTAQEDKGEKRQLIVILVHGTWSTSERWTRDGSEFKEGLQAGLAARYRAIEHRTVIWSGKNRWSARERTTHELAALTDTCRLGERAASENLPIQGGGCPVVGHFQPPASRRPRTHHGEGDLRRVCRTAGADHWFSSEVATIIEGGR